MWTWYFACVHWLSLRSWVCRGQPAVCCWGWAMQCCQGKQVSVGAAAARPEAVHGENDTWPSLCLCNASSQYGFMLSSTWEEALITCLLFCVVSARVLALLSFLPLPVFRVVPIHNFYLLSVLHDTRAAFTNLRLLRLVYQKLVQWLIVSIWSNGVAVKFNAFQA